MPHRRTARAFACILALYGLLLLPGAFRPAYFDSPAGLLVLVPALSIYLLAHAGIPGLLEHGGLCGWGVCAPTVTGWLVMGAIWLGLAWLLARGIAALAGRFSGRTGRSGP